MISTPSAVDLEYPGILLSGWTFPGSAPHAVPLEGLATWFDASLPTMYQDESPSAAASLDGDRVALWLDRSGKGRHATQSTLGRRPVYRTAGTIGAPGVEFDGVDDFLASSFAGITGALTLFAIGQRLAPGDVGLGDTVIGAVSQNIHLFDRTLAAGGAGYWNAGGGGGIGAGGPFPSGRYSAVVTLNPIGSSALRVNGAQVGTSSSLTAVSWGGIVLAGRMSGGASSANVRLHEVLLFSRLLTLGQIGSIERRLMGKWGIGS